MQDLTPDMEDLLRRASENYPLSKGPDRWEEIEGKLSVKAGPGALKKKDNKKRFFLLLCLLLFLVTSFYFLVNIGFPGKKRLSEAKSSPVAAGNAGPAVKVSSGNLQWKEPADVISSGRPDIKDEKQLLRRSQSSALGFEHLPYNLSTRVEKEYIPVTPPFPVTGHSILGTLFQQKPWPLIKNRDINNTYNNKRLYYGALAGPVFTTVKGRGWTRPGFDAGLLLGYRFDERLSAEVSILFTQNFYETKAEHFNSKGIASMLNGGRKLNEVHGNNKVLEMPVNIKWQPVKGRSRFYLSGGISSFLMTRESNWYLTTMNGTDEMLYGKYYEKKPYLLAAAQFSAGFEKKIGRKSSLRIQPYIQVPLKGIGIGDLHLLSTGIQVGITRPVD